MTAKEFVNKRIKEAETTLDNMVLARYIPLDIGVVFLKALGSYKSVVNEYATDETLLALANELKEATKDEAEVQAELAKVGDR